MNKLLSFLFASVLIFSFASLQGQEKLTREQLVNFPETISNTLSHPTGWKDNNNIVFIKKIGDNQQKLLYNIKTNKFTNTEIITKVNVAPPKIAGADNVTFSPDSLKVAYTKNNDLYYKDLSSGKEYRLTNDGSELILNGYASWVYYEEILGRGSRYKAFWWSPDSKKLGFYRFDNTDVPMFPIYNASGHQGTLARTRYPKAGDPNPKVRVGIVDISTKNHKVVWGDFDENVDQYFGVPFWPSNSDTFILPWMPRVQNTMLIYALNCQNGEKKEIYSEKQATWIDWINRPLFTEEGMYIVRDFEMWDQIYFLSYDGTKLEKLSSGNNWGMRIVKLDKKKGLLFYTAKNEDCTRTDLFKLTLKNKKVEKISFGDYTFSSVSISPDSKKYIAVISNCNTPSQLIVANIGKKVNYKVIEDSRGADFDKYKLARTEIIKIKTDDGYILPARVTYPVDFDSTKKYPMLFKIYGGPSSASVADGWSVPSFSNQWWANEGVILASIDSRTAGHNGKKGMNCAYGKLGEVELEDFILWVKYFRTLPFVNAAKIGITGFSYGGTMTAKALLYGNEYFKYGIAGGGVYDWSIYDSHYTERYMNTPQNNPEGYKNSAVIGGAAGYIGDSTSMLRITHGTSDDNVHFQNTLQLITALQNENKIFELMIYPGAYHGYRGAQKIHSNKEDMIFWYKYLLDTTPPEILMK